MCNHRKEPHPAAAFGRRAQGRSAVAYAGRAFDAHRARRAGQIASARRAAAAKDLKEAGLLKTSSTSPGKVNIKTQVLVAYCQWRTNVSLVFSVRRTLLESSAAAPSNETRIAQAPVAERPVALPPARRWSCKCGSRYSP